MAQVNLMAYKYKEGARLTEDDFYAVVLVANEVQAEIDLESQPKEDTSGEPTE